VTSISVCGAGGNRPQRGALFHGDAMLALGVSRRGGNSISIDPGPREIILPHNPLLTHAINISVGDVMIGKPLGMSCGCQIIRCRIMMEVDRRTGVIV
jgi:hypothetical protein